MIVAAPATFINYLVIRLQVLASCASCFGCLFMYLILFPCSIYALSVLYVCCIYFVSMSGLCLMCLIWLLLLLIFRLFVCPLTYEDKAAVIFLFDLSTCTGVR